MKRKEHLLSQIEERLKFLHELGVDLLSRDWLTIVKGVKKSRVPAERDHRMPGKSKAERQEKIKRAGKGKASFQSLMDLRNDIGDCTRCKLHRGRTHVVFGAGNPQADLMFIGEAPGVDEDIQGLPFVGRAGQLLTRIIKAIDMEREDVYIANIIKCRPPQNRSPQPDEIETCVPFLFRQIEIIEPKIIIALGSFAAQRILNTKLPITSLRGRFMKFKDIRVMPTFHPAYLLRNMNKKREVWEDMKLVRDELKVL